MDYTTIRGTMLDLDGSPFAGAILHFKLNENIHESGHYTQDNVKTVYANSLGRFELSILANSVSSDPESHYVVTVVQDTIRDIRVVVPASKSPVRFENLERYKLPFERLPELGAC